MRNTVLQLDPRDNVLVALKPLRKGDSVSFLGSEYTLLSDIPAKHKFVSKDLAAGDQIIMYGGLVGTMSEALRRGDLLSTKNLRHAASDYHSSTISPPRWTTPDVAKWRDRTFLGYHRSDGQVGTRNHWLVVPLVFCENRNLGVLKQAFEEELGFALPQVYRRQVAEMVKLFREGKTEELKDFQAEKGKSPASTAPRVFKNIDGIKFLTHEQGCGSTREDTRNLCGILAGYIHHPNVAGATILSLGCQHAQTATLVEEIKKRDPNFSKPLLVFDQQQMGEESKMLSKAIHDTFVGLLQADTAERKPAPLSKLVVGLKCGGSDGFSGISANPAIGHTADILAALGGRGILSEFPELCGVEQQLIDRSVSREVGDKYMNLMRDYAARAKAVFASFEMNPSPGNVRDGLLTDAMKSAGAAKKGGTSPVTAALDYPEYSSVPGLNLLCTPGSDVECVSAQVGAGANVVLFTTGLGTPTGNPITPVMKLSTNSELARRMPDIIDIDTGSIIEGETTIEKMGEEVLEKIIQVASGEVHVKAEILAQNDFIPWKRGVSL
ncbi:MAG TPA: altronate dehydratase family protein [Candidatus Sulfotelmatobacter sp.]|nr:altronate dehydratase family protein [Candidatus Sulfotelmatobacter sp.]